MIGFIIFHNFSGEDVDFISRKSDIALETSEPGITNTLINQTFTSAFVVTPVPKTILADANTRLQNVLYPSMFIPSFHNIKTVQTLSETALSVFNVLVTGHSVLYPMVELAETNNQKLNIAPSRASNFHPAIGQSNKFGSDPYLTLNDYSKINDLSGNQLFNDSQNQEGVIINEDVNAVKNNKHLENILSNMITNEFEMGDLNMDKKELRQTNSISNEILINKGKLNYKVKGDNKFQNNQIKSSNIVINANQNDMNYHHENREKVVTIFTDVFVILGKDAQTDKDFMRNTDEIKSRSSTRYEIHPTATPLQSQHRSLQYPVMESIIDMPQPSFTNIADNLYKMVEMSSTAASFTSSQIKDYSAIVPAEIMPPKLLKEPIKPSVSIDKHIADPGRMLLNKPDIIVIHINRNAIQNVNEESQITEIQPNTKDSISFSKNQIAQEQLPVLNEISEPPELFEMHEIRLPPVATNLKSDIHWINVLNVPSGSEESRGNHELLNTAKIKLQVELERQVTLNSIAFQDGLPVKIQTGTDLTSLVKQSSGSEKKILMSEPLPDPFNDQQRVNDFLNKLTTGNPDLFRYPVAKGNIQRVPTFNNLETREDKTISQNVSPKLFPGKIKTFISTDSQGKENFINVITRPKATRDKAHTLLGKDRSFRLVNAYANAFGDGKVISNNYGIQNDSHLGHTFKADRTFPFHSIRQVFPVNHIRVTDLDSYQANEDRNERTAIFGNVSLGMQTPQQGVSGAYISNEPSKSHTERQMVRKGGQSTGIQRQVTSPQLTFPEHSTGHGLIGLHTQDDENTGVLNKESQRPRRKYIPFTKQRNLFTNQNILGQSRPINKDNQNNGIPMHVQRIHLAKQQQVNVGENIGTLSNGISGIGIQKERGLTIADQGLTGNAQHVTKNFGKHNPVHINDGIPFNLQNQQGVRFGSKVNENMPGVATHRQSNIKSKIPSNIYQSTSNQYDRSNFSITGLQRNMGIPSFSNNYEQINYPIQRTPFGRRRKTSVPFIDQRNKRRKFQNPKQNDRIKGYTNGYYVEPWYFLAQKGVDSAGQTAPFVYNDNRIYKQASTGKRTKIINGLNKHLHPNKIPVPNSQYKLYHTRRMKNKSDWWWTSGKQLLLNQPYNYGFSNNGQLDTFSFNGGYKSYKTYSSRYSRNWCKFIFHTFHNYWFLN